MVEVGSAVTGWKPGDRVFGIIGGGGHGLAAAYYLASEHGMRNIAVLEKGWLGGGNTGRNTTVIRSNYLFDESAALYDHALKIWEDLTQVLNYNLMFSQRGPNSTKYWSAAPPLSTLTWVGHRSMIASRSTGAGVAPSKAAMSPMT